MKIRRNKPAAAEELPAPQNNSAYEVGYAKPPVHTVSSWAVGQPQGANKGT